MSNLRLSSEAQNDLSEIKKYITEELENPKAVLSTVKNITKSIRILIDHPMAGEQLSSVANVDDDCRFLVSGNYIVFYRISNSNVYVDRVLYGCRDYLRVLFDD
ncbi:type II toxin-antitoxin system RelE/ParE family toxin [Aminicella lysinilytica]|uniref:Addiction module RelE/StbE family toxin n=1 Tax=Aminicella lysinilytica TaxID=433323 RepID=A0A4R6QAE8_9FIRM|nr:type II toxin-antitoxin system RelE/ParE family toxin [Aminicella lysinilytica]NLD10217.1 type II toxin-antitoxin system RelE/ParE family toxin [Clostridiales bacterium]TDP59598.1 addiction module RelE/StbE family toxin [Aminicella lysinilytica]